MPAFPEQGDDQDPQQQPPTDPPVLLAAAYQIDQELCQCQCRGQFDRKYAGNQCVSVNAYPLTSIHHPPPAHYRQKMTPIVLLQ